MVGFPGRKWTKIQDPGYDGSGDVVVPISGQLRHLAVADLGLSLVATRLGKHGDETSIFWRGAVHVG